MEYYSAMQKKTLDSVLMRRMKLEPIIQREIPRVSLVCKPEIPVAPRDEH